MSSSQTFSSVGSGAMPCGSVPDVLPKPGAGAGSAAVVVMRPIQTTSADGWQVKRPAHTLFSARTLDAVEITQSIRTAIIGAGPRGTSVLERLLARCAAQIASGSGPVRLHIDVIDPYPAGPGHVWQPGQSRLFLMNTQSFYPTLVPQDPALAPPIAGSTFDQWRARQ